MVSDSRRLKAIRRVIGKVGLGADRAKAALKTIEEIASGKANADKYFAAPDNANLQERLEKGAASRSPMKGDKPEPEPKKRKEKGGRNRQEQGGETREAAPEEE